MSGVRGKTGDVQLPLAWTGGSTIRGRERVVDVTAAPRRARHRLGPRGRKVVRMVRNAAIVMLPVTAWLVPPPQALLRREPQQRLARYQVMQPGSSYLAGDADPTAASDYGRELFLQSCAACHGAEGQGLPHQGAGLRASSFVAARSDAELLRFLQHGRQPRDPHSQLGLVMPGRGMPPLSDAQLARVLGYLRELQRQHAGDGGDGGGNSGNSSASAREVEP